MLYLCRNKTKYLKRFEHLHTLYKYKYLKNIIVQTVLKGNSALEIDIKL